MAEIILDVHQLQPPAPMDLALDALSGNAAVNGIPVEVSPA